MIVPAYVPGDWYAVVTDGSVALLPSSAPASLVASLWDAARDGADLTAQLQVLLRQPLASLPPFALVTVHGQEAHVVVRGDAEVEVTGADGATRTVAAGHVATWTEEVVGRAHAVEARVGGAAPSGAALPVLSAVVRAAAVRVDLTADDDGAGPARPAGGAAVAAGTSPEPPSSGTPADERPEPEPADAWDLRATWQPLTGPVPTVPPAPDAGATDAGATDAGETDASAADANASGTSASDRSGAASSAEASSAADQDPGRSDDVAPAPSHPGRPDPGTVEPDTFEPVTEPTPGPVAPAPLPAPEHRPTAEPRPVPGPRPAPEPVAVGSLVTAAGTDPTALPQDHDGLTVLSTDVVALRRQMPEWAGDDVPGPLAVPAAATPPPAKIVLSSGLVVSLNRPVLLGRAPQVSRVSNSRLPRLVTVASPNQDISRTHAEVRQEGEDVVVTDLRSTNGVLLLRQGGAPQRLHPGEPTVVDPGVVVDLGEGVTFTVERG